MSAREPGQVRKEAALSGHRQAQRDSPGLSDRRREGPENRLRRGGDGRERGGGGRGRRKTGLRGGRRGPLPPPPRPAGVQRCSPRHEALPPTAASPRGGAATSCDGSRGSNTNARSTRRVAGSTYV